MAAGGKSGGKGKGADDKKSDVQEILYNRKLRHEHEILDRWEAGLVLLGSEVKSLRNGDVQWAGAHARIDGRGECWLYDLHIGEYKQAVLFGHKPTQPRKLLLSRKELDKISGKVEAKGLTLMPEVLLFRKGWAKIVICLCRGKDRADKRQDLMQRAQQRDVEREMARRLKR
jgi:SsrA-binding protein